VIVALAMSIANAHHSTFSHAANNCRQIPVARMTVIDLPSVKFYFTR
jgi:hypothetical protein